MKNDPAKVNIIIQARMGSTRLPGKILKPVLNRPLLSLLLERVRRVHAAHSIIIATTTNPNDDIIEQFCKKENVPFYRGSEEDVLDRYYQTALTYPTDIIVRITSDCPLIDPVLIDYALQLFLKQAPNIDYLSNVQERTFPRGMDIEIFSFECLQKAAEKSNRPYDREHVTSYIYNHPEQFKLVNFAQEINQSSYRLTLDTAEDLRLITKIFETLYPTKKNFTLQDILKILQIHPDWMEINAHVKQKEV